MSPVIGFLFLFITMILWGSWPNFLKKDKTLRFELFYWDFVLGMVITGVITLFFWNFSLGDFSLIAALKSGIAGVIFNLGNLLFVAALSLCGLTVAFPIVMGTSVIVGVLMSLFIELPHQMTLPFVGVLAIFLSICVITHFYKKREQDKALVKKALSISLISGLILALFYPIFIESMMSPRMSSSGLMPVTALIFFIMGAVISMVLIGWLFMRRPIHGKALGIKNYLELGLGRHLYGIFAGILWAGGMFLQSHGIRSASPVIAFGLMQCVPLLGMEWGIFYLKEHRLTKTNTSLLIAFLFFYIVGSLFLGLSFL